MNPYGGCTVWKTTMLGCCSGICHFSPFPFQSATDPELSTAMLSIFSAGLPLRTPPKGSGCCKAPPAGSLAMTWEGASGDPQRMTPDRKENRGSPRTQPQVLSLLASLPLTPVPLEAGPNQHPLDMGAPEKPSDSRSYAITGCWF